MATRLSSLQSDWIPPSLSAARMDRVNTLPSGSLKRAREPSPSPGSGRAEKPLTPSPTKAAVTQVVGQVPNGSNSLATGTAVRYVTSALADQPAFNRVYANNSMMHNRPNPFRIPPQPSQPAAIHATATKDQPLDKQMKSTQTEQPVQHILDYPCTHNGQRQAVQHQLCDHAACQLRLAPDPRLASFHPACLASFEVVNINRFRLAGALSISTNRLDFDEDILAFTWDGMESESSNASNEEKLKELRADYPSPYFSDALAFVLPSSRDPLLDAFSDEVMGQVVDTNHDRLLLAIALSVPIRELYFNGPELALKWKGMVSEIMSASRQGRLQKLTMQYLTLPPPDKPFSRAGYLTARDKEDIMVLVSNVVPRAQHWAPLERMMSGRCYPHATDAAALVMEVHKDLGEGLIRFITVTREDYSFPNPDDIEAYLSQIPNLLIQASAASPNDISNFTSRIGPMSPHFQQRLGRKTGKTIADVIVTAWRAANLKVYLGAPRVFWNTFRPRLEVVAKTPFVRSQAVLGDDILEILERPHLRRGCW